jgi:hypothetical protein
MELLRKLAIKLEVRLRARPADLFQFCTLLFMLDLTGRRFVALMGAVSCSGALSTALIFRFDVKARQSVLAFMDQYAGCRFAPVQVNEVMGTDFIGLVGARSIGGESPGWRRRA